MAKPRTRLQTQQAVREKLLEVSEGVITYLADVLLFMAVYGLELCKSGHTSRGAGQAYARAIRELCGAEEDSTRKGLRNLSQKGYVKYSRGVSDVEITAAGKKRLQQLLPTYEKERKWDERLYLITYDIQEDKKRVRDRFREWLKQLGCGMLQASVWITPYDPREVLREFVFANRLEGSVLLSYVGKDGNIGGTDLKSLVKGVYRLDELNDRYKEFLESNLESWPRYRVAMAFHSILKDDPQLPFKLLPEDWKGDEAYKRFSTLLPLTAKRPLGK